MYHAFPETVPGLQEALARQCAYIKRHYNIISMDEIGRCLRNGTPLPKNALAVTVDDGCRAFLLSGGPVFQAYNIPVLVYLVSGFLDGKLWFWWDQVAYAISKTKLPVFQLTLAPGEPPTSFNLETEERREQATYTIVMALKKLNAEERRRSANGHLARILEVDLPADPPSHMAPLRWPEVRELAKKGVNFGAHTVTHPMLSQIQDPQALLKEIGESKARIEEEIGSPVRHFCYPFGRLADFNDDAVQAVEQSGFLTATTAQFGLNDLDRHPLRLKRLGADPMMSWDYFRETLAGVHFV